MSAHGNLDVRVMTPNDIAAADILRQSAGWNQTHRDWQRLLTYEPTGCFVAEIDQQVVGTVTTTSYGTELAWIGMMLVHQDFRRRGIGTKLMKRAMDYLTELQVQCIKLDATPAGEPVYRRLGFEAEWNFHRWAKASDEDSLAILPDGSDFAVPDWDARAFGADRSSWLKMVAADSKVLWSEGGFAMLRTGRNAGYLGPVSALDSATATELTTSLLSEVAGAVYWDIPSANTAAEDLAISHGFERIRELKRMNFGSNTLLPRLNRQYGLVDPGTG